MNLPEMTLDGAVEKKPAIYVRTSTITQKTASQMNELGAWLTRWRGISGAELDLIKDDVDARNEWMAANATWYVDHGASGDTLDRPGFNALQKAIDDGLHDHVVVWKIDRLSRKMADGIKVLADWTDRGLRFTSTSQGINADGIVSKMIAAVLLAVAEMEQETRRERTSAGVKAAIEADPMKFKRAAAKSAAARVGYRKGNFSEVESMLKRGFTPTEIAKNLGLGRSTVYRYVDELKKESSNEG